ncbi:MAG: isoprenyl transferase [Lachnospiraceae bacterium]|nr:isoprenyl transferase [Lachnospiraceae bacterium]
MPEIPKHIAIILDGNGRWAKSKGMPRTYGHKKGAENVENVCRAAYELGVSYLTVYAFSTENWSRPSDEVKALMLLLDNYLEKCLEMSEKNNMRVRVIGDLSKLEKKMQERIAVLEEASKDYTGLTFIVALNYGSRDEILRAARRIAADVRDEKLAVEDIEEETFSRYLDTDGIPDPDLMIRTSGEQRLSNYLLWQLAYAEFYFTPVAWPDFDKAELEKAIRAYQDRDRRYGKV